jgi:hypothetical protein
MNPITIIAFHPTGYELHIPVTFEELPATMRRLAARGYTPSREPVLTAEGLPICPRHGVPMQQRNRNGDLWFSHKMVHPTSGETVYCRGYAGVSSPGYDILLPLSGEGNGRLEDKQSGESAQAGVKNGASGQPGLGTIQAKGGNGHSPQLPATRMAAKDAAIHSTLFGG